MVYGIYFDTETRNFSVIEDREFGVKDIAGAVGKHISNNSRAYIGGASAIVGGTAGALIARKKAKAAAEAAGLKPGTPEYKKFMAKKMAIGTAAGAVAGGAASELGHLGVKTVKGYKELAPGKGEKWTALKLATGQSARSMYGRKPKQ